MTQTIGTCSNCGGRVSIPRAWLGINPPVPQCERCHATAKQPHGPVVDMDPPPRPSLPNETVINDTPHI